MRLEFPIDQRRAEVLRRLDRLAFLLDSAFRIPGTRRTFGLDALLSIVPVVGSFVGAAISLYILLEAVRMEAPRSLLLKMLGNVGIDWLIGEIPIIGFVFDLFFKANERNTHLLRRFLQGLPT